MSRGELALWVVVPYACLTVFVVGHIWRYRRDQFTWTSRSTQLLEGRMLRVGVLLFHVGLLAVIGGHVLGILVPKSVTESAGLSEHGYHVISVTAGTIAGAATLTGFAILLYRRLTVPRVRTTTSTSDRLTYLLLGSVMTLGMVATVGENLLGGGYDYRETVAPWFRGLFTLDPDGALMASAPLVYQLHAIAAWLLFAAWPFSRLVHAWSVPVAYLNRPAHILYRARPVVPRRRPARALPPR